MKLVNTIILFFISTLLYSQGELKELLNYIETNQKQLSDFESYEKNIYFKFYFFGNKNQCTRKII
ncbi:hypothetical protein FLAVO9AF_910008 [Flavobacterium sp. 9AF]|nr:hypothetical protein FLAVO9AF_910008 [Flavobacterium sp. 9AF]